MTIVPAQNSMLKTAKITERVFTLLNEVEYVLTVLVISVIILVVKPRAIMV